MTAPTLNDMHVVDAARELIPLLRSRSPWIEENRRLPEDVLEGLADAGVFRMRVPSRYGGLDATAQDMVRVSTELGRGDGSIAWTASVWWIPTWMVGFFPEVVQDEVFSEPDVRVCGALSPGGRAVPVKGGYLVSGSWQFISGALHSHWQEVVVMTPTPDGQGEYPVAALIPMGELTIHDDWHTAGVRGSGSVTTTAEQVFVPSERVMPLPAILRGRPATQANAGSSIYEAPFSAYAASACVGALVGLATAAVEVFEERLLAGRGITYTGYTSQREAPVTHLQIAQAVIKRDAAEFHAHRIARTVDTKSAAGETWTPLELARGRADQAAVADLAIESTESLDQASGGSSIRLDSPIQRIARDVRGIAKHPLIYPTSAYELYGRLLCGLEPNTHYI